MNLNEIIEKILEISKIEEVIGEFISISKVGNNYRGFSPFSNEKFPSFMVSPEKKIWKDFSSGKGGNVINFLIEYENLNFWESLKWIANKYNIDLNLYNKNKFISINNKSINKNISILYLTNIFFKKQLKKEKEAFFYLKKRNFKKKIIDFFNIGYYPKNKKYLLYNYLKKNLYKKYFIKYEKYFIKEINNFNLFYNRITFPIYNLSGKIIGFGGRIINNEKINFTKYINSKTTNYFHKNKILYGIYHTKKFILKKGFCFLVEGYTDLIRMFQLGIKNVVSSLGVSITNYQIKIIKKFTNKVILFYDKDSAGFIATVKNINIFLKENVQIKILFPPKGEDPDSFLEKKKKNEIKKFIKNNIKDFLDFKIDFFLKEKNLIIKSFIIKKIIKNISKINDNIYREICINKLSYISKIHYKFLKKEINKYNNNINKNININKKENIIIKNLENINNLEEEIINFSLKYGFFKLKNKKYETFIEYLYNFLIFINFNFYISFNKIIFNNIIKIIKDNKLKYFFLKKIFKNKNEIKNVNNYFNYILLRCKYITISKNIKKIIKNKFIKKKYYIKYFNYFNNLIFKKVKLRNKIIKIIIEKKI